MTIRLITRDDTGRKRQFDLHDCDDPLVAIAFVREKLPRHRTVLALVPKRRPEKVEQAA